MTSLNHHQKWSKPHRNVQISDLVLIKDEKIFHCQWPLARVIKVFPGEDGRARVADAKTQRGIYRRPTNKLVVLLTQQEAISQDAPSGGGEYGRYIHNNTLLSLYFYFTRFHDLFVIITYPLVTILVISFSYLEGKGP